MIEGTLEINLKGTELVVEEPKGWLSKIGSMLFGKKEYEKEIVTQMQYLEKVYSIFTSLGWNNIVSLNLGDEVVYEDKEHKEDDFKEAVNLAYQKIEKKDFEVSIVLENSAGESVDIEFSSKHDIGDYPLTISVELDKSEDEVTASLNEMKEKINGIFGIESGEITVEESNEDSEDEEDDEDSEDDDSDEDSDDEDDSTPVDESDDEVEDSDEEEEEETTEDEDEEKKSE